MRLILAALFLSTVPTREAIGRHSAPVQDLEGGPLHPHCGEIAVLEAAGGGGEAAVEVDEPAGAPDPPDEVEVFEQGDAAKASDPVVDLAAHKNPRIAVIEPEQAQPGVDEGQLAGGTGGTVEGQPEVAA